MLVIDADDFCCQLKGIFGIAFQPIYLYMYENITITIVTLSLDEEGQKTNKESI